MRLGANARLRLPTIVFIALLFCVAVLSCAFLLPRVVLAQDSPATTVGAAPSGKHNMTMDDFLRITEIEDAQISPEGKWVAYRIGTNNTKDDKYQKRIWMVATSGGEAIPLTRESESASHPRWSNDGKYIAFLSAHEEGKSEDDSKKQVWTLRREGGEAEQLTDTIQDVDDFAWSPSGDRMVLVLQDPTLDELEAAKNKNKEKDSDAEDAKPKPHPWVIDRLHFKEDEIGYLDRHRKHLYVFTLADRKLTQITSGDYDDTEPAWSPDGRSIAFTSNRTEDADMNFNTDIWVVKADNVDRGKSLVRVSTNPGEDESPTWSPDGKWIAFTSRIEPKIFWYATAHLAIASAAGGEEKVLTRKLDRNVESPRFSADGKWIYFIDTDDGTQDLLRIPSEGGEISRVIADRHMVNSFSMLADGTVAAAISGVSQPAQIYLLTANRELRKLTTTNDALIAQLRLPEVEYVHFKSKDGTSISGYLYKPVDYKPGVRYPTILRPHGGPALAYLEELIPDPQFLAANGYVVLAPNPRGSIGYGEDFCKAIFADWGNKDYQDDMAMVDYAIAQGIADPERLGVGGHSYGAISTNFIIAQTDRFKAALSNAGEFLMVTGWGHDEYIREWEYELGLPWENRALWDKLSMFNSATKIKTPTLITGGDIDWNVPIANSEQMYVTLKRLGIPTMLIVYPGEYHDFVRPSFVADLRIRMLFWFNHYILGEGPAAPPQQPGD
jgi:dipeptidyl aminopeptidase/acylaminoacyl peptidase